MIINIVCPVDDNDYQYRLPIDDDNDYQYRLSGD
jgi:hypothetical protein